MKVKISLIFFFFIAPQLSIAQKANLWVTYTHSKYLHSPGIESNYFFNNYFGVQLGASVYFQKYEQNEITNYCEDYSFKFYNANLGLAVNIINSEKHNFGITSGFKIYYGPDFKPLHYYKKEHYMIYYDASGFQPTYGLDLGMFYNFKHLTTLLKFDTARNQLRIGVGYTFKRKT